MEKGCHQPVHSHAAIIVMRAESDKPNINERELPASYCPESGWASSFTATLCFSEFLSNMFSRISKIKEGRSMNENNLNLETKKR